MGKPEGKIPLGRPRRSWEVNIKIDLREVGCDPVDWIALAQDRFYILASINHSVLPKGRSYTANSALSTLPSSQPSLSYLHTFHL